MGEHSFRAAGVLLLVSCIVFTHASTLYDELTVLNATSFLSYVDKAGLASMLQDPATSLTLLVPTNAAFAKIPAADLAAVANNKNELIEQLKYMMVSGVHTKHNFLFGRHYFLNTTNGHTLRVYRSASGLHFNQAHATKIDANATNGIIYLINTVLDVPEGTVIDILGNPDYNISKFLQIVKQAHLDTNYANPTGLNRYTMFAPSNTAMDALPQATLNSISQDYTNLRMMVEYHVHSGTMHLSTVAKHHFISTTLPAHNISVSTSTSGAIVLNNIATIIDPDIEGENGVVHIIDHVLMPEILKPIIG